MNLFQILRKLYEHFFSFGFDSDFDLDRAFNDIDKFHSRSLPDSDNKLEAMYAKVFKTNAFYLLSPLVFLWLKFQFAKYSNSEYLESLIQKSINREE